MASPRLQSTPLIHSRLTELYKCVYLLTYLLKHYSLEYSQPESLPITAAEMMITGTTSASILRLQGEVLQAVALLSPHRETHLSNTSKCIVRNFQILIVSALKI